MACGHPMYRGENGRCTCPKCDPLRYASAEGYAEHMQRLGDEIGAAMGVQIHMMRPEGAVGCQVCGAPVDTREEDEGGGPDGCELHGGGWVCSGACYDRAVPDDEKSR